MAYYRWLRALVYGVGIYAVAVAHTARVGVAVLLGVMLFETFARCDRHDSRRHPAARGRKR